MLSYLAHSFPDLVLTKLVVIATFNIRTSNANRNGVKSYM